MPKGRKKYSKYENYRTEQPASSDEDAGIDMTNDNCSEISVASDSKSNHDEAIESEIEKFDEKVMEIIDNLSARAAQARAGALVALRNALQRRHVGTLLVNQRATLADIVARAIRRGRDAERKAAAALAPLLALQKLRRRFANKTASSFREIEKFNYHVMEIIDNLSARSSQARTAALMALRSALQRHHVGELLANQCATLANIITRAIRRGRDAERKAAAALGPLLALQIGEEGSEEFMSEVRPALAAAAVDKSASVETRTECCSSLAVLCYLLEEDISEILEIMKMYETIFSGSYLKGDGSVKVSGAVIEEAVLHAAALDGWALMLTLVSPTHAQSLLQNAPPSLARLASLLEAHGLEVRMAAGGALAIVHEHISEVDEAIDSHIEPYLPRLEELARDSHKFRAKRDRKLQRATFRDILKYFEEDEAPEMSVRVGSESVVCDTWALCGAYSALAAALGGGLNALAPYAPALRRALRLQDTPAIRAPAKRLNKLQRHLQNSAASKARTVARNKSRDKRSAALAI